MRILENRQILIDGLRELGIEPNEDILEKLDSFKDIMISWNEKINLTAITEEREVYIKHFLDSATCLSTGYIKDGMKVIDVGTGAGFPGVPLKILKSDMEMTLLDSLNKRISYLDEVVAKLGLKGVKTVHARAEEAGSSKACREAYDIVLSRAVAAMNVLCEYCMPFTKVGGFFLCQKGPDIEEELAEAKKAISMLGGKIREVKEYQLPFSDIK
ncbi:MAG TPA: 16S rRNA (guanine(527)-N(7))-methyltransferase RsmG, partial [Negativicutes bacterium]|nr:16S rRNA (guanine(527)-N(7))-methyltransferase RsmG [Negativicutes bacterium]